ncbi:MAG TPA: hypothetical protein VKH42_03140 [Vicinamibacterales bacterium]|nr:hypothetical protein [Vicinamibacterales bacterium]
MTVLLTVTLASMVLALVMSVIAWRVAREERDRSDARVANLAAEIHSVAPAAAGGSRRVDTGAARLKAVTPAAPQSADLFAAPPAASSSRSVIVVGVGLLVFATAAALIVVLGSGAPSGARARTPSAAGRAAGVEVGQAAATAPAVPLELVALGHDRDGDTLTVRGVVRNPSNGARVDGVTAVVFMFDRDGGFLGSGRGAIDARTLAPGGDSTFQLTVPGAGNVARYRVSFRTETGIVAHVDKRTR